MPITLSVPGMQSLPAANGQPLQNGFFINFSLTIGILTTLIANVKTVSIPGLLTTDVVELSCTDSLNQGVGIANVRVSAADTLEIIFITSIVLGLNISTSLNFRLLVMR